MQIKVPLYRRLGAGQQFASNGIVVPQDGVINSTGIVKGQSVDGIDDWHTDVNGFYYWAGGLAKIATASGNAPDIKITGNWCLDALQIPAIWAALGDGNSGKGIKVAVLDTGMDASTSLLMNIVQKVHCYTNEYDNGYKVGNPIICSEDDVITDSAANYHGTGTASVIGASSLNGYYAGIAPNVSLSVFKILDNYFFNRSKKQIPNVLRQISKQDFDVVCMSFQFTDVVEDLADSIKACADAGILLFAAAGNDGVYMVNYPAFYDGCHGVSACDKNLKSLIPSSSFSEKVNLVAPGVQVPVYTNNQQQGLLDDTSIATAITAGVAALLLSYTKQFVSNKQAAAKQVMDALIQFGTPVSIPIPGQQPIVAKIIQPYQSFLHLKNTNE